MARNIQFQILRGYRANIPSDLASGEMYYAVDTNEFFIGTGSGYVKMGPCSVQQSLAEPTLPVPSLSPPTLG